MKAITENEIELDAIETLESLGWEYIHGLQIAPGAEQWERENFEQVILIERLRKRLSIINAEIPENAREQAISKILALYAPDLISNNEEFHKFLIEKVKIPYTQDGYPRSHEVALIDFETPENNEFLVVNQFTVIENNRNKRPDLVLFVNGIPLVVIELKNAADEKATIRSAFEQIQTYKAMIPSLFKYNAVCVISDGMECKAGSFAFRFFAVFEFFFVNNQPQNTKNYYCNNSDKHTNSFQHFERLLNGQRNHYRNKCQQKPPNKTCRDSTENTFRVFVWKTRPR